MPVPSPGVTASATIEPLRLVKISGAFTVATCGANEICLGITTEKANADHLTTPHALSGQQVSLNMARGGTYPIRAGATIAAGVRFKSDATGRAVTSLTTGTVNQEFAGQTLEAGVVNERILVVFDPGTIRPAIV